MDLELENSRRAELRSEIELLKTLHAKEILECRFQIQSLLDSNSIDAFRKTQLEKTCEDFKATVSDLSLSLTKLRDTNEREAAEARSNILQLKSQLQASQAAQDRIAAELDEVKSTLANVMDDAEIAATTQAKRLDTVRTALAEAERNFVASQNAYDNTASELQKVRSELSAAKGRKNVFGFPRA